MGALLGVGGGVILVPALVLGFKVPLEEAVPASLMCVVASSCGAAASYVTLGMEQQQRLVLFPFACRRRATPRGEGARRATTGPNV